MWRSGRILDWYPPDGLKQWLLALFHYWKFSSDKAWSCFSFFMYSTTRIHDIHDQRRQHEKRVRTDQSPWWFLYSVKVGGDSSFKPRSLNKIYKFTFKICWVELTEVARLKLMAICITLYINWKKQLDRYLDGCLYYHG